MKELITIADTLKKIKSSIRVICIEETIKLSGHIQELNRDQLHDGIDAFGASMPNYVVNSKQPSAPGPITLFDSGSFHANFKMRDEGDGFTVESGDWKFEILDKKYKAMGLNQQSLDLLKPMVIEKVIARINKMIQ